MGSGSGGSYETSRSSNDIQHLTNTAKDSLNKGYERAKKKTIFICGVAEDKNTILSFINEIESDFNNASFIKTSINDNSLSEQYKFRVTNKIKQCWMSICFISQNSYNNELLEYQLKECMEAEKTIIGVNINISLTGILDEFIKRFPMTLNSIDNKESVYSLNGNSRKAEIGQDPYVRSRVA